MKRELLKNMLYNLISFTIIFTVFSMMILTQFVRYLYTSVDNELRQVKSQLRTIPKIVLQSTPTGITDNSETLLIEILKGYLEKVSNPRVLAILRNDKGEVIASSLSSEIFIDYWEESSFSGNNDDIYEVCFDSKYYYRGITCKLDTFNGKYYIELLVNINSEKVMMTNFTNTLFIGTGIVIVLAIFISFYLSKRALTPIVEAYKQQAEFVQNASHELRTPLTIIQAKQEMLLQSPESKIIDKSEDIALTLNETRRLSKMIAELMELARSDSHKNMINKSRIDLNSLIKSVVVPYQEMAEMQNKTIVVNANCNKEANVDPNKIKQLVIILLDNALKYTETNDSIELDIRNVEEKIFINVKDTGIGVSDETIKHAFERFYREDKARSREKGGTGLGLSIAHTIVKAHGGSIKMLHNKPKGTMVIVKL